ncbi:hypothetical protein L218DRAFT_651352 [Marasmius fiardii PR-910]|nr:hypothetical protein L218DRAFT_651352 [Marasmius fiardii PR-910]
MYVGKAPPKCRRRSPYLVDASPAVRDYTTASTSPAALRKPPESVKVERKVEVNEIKMFNTTGSTSQSAPRGPQRSFGTQIKAEVTEVKMLNTRGEIYRDHCIQCGNTPVIEDSDDHGRRVLKDILAAVDLSSAAPALKAFGMYHDGHLHLLDVLKPTERRDVMKGIPNVPVINAYALIKHLEERATGRDSSSAIDMLCDAHRTSFISENPVSRILESTLKLKGLEVLVPIAALYGIFGDRQLDMLLTFNESDLDDFFNTYHPTRASLFYRRLLRVALKASELTNNLTGVGHRNGDQGRKTFRRIEG